MRAILTYHSVDDSGSPISIDPTTFRRHVDWLADGPVQVTDIPTLLRMPDDADAAALAFDDGYRNFATHAWPLLRDRDLPATLFVVAGKVGCNNRWGGKAEPGIPDLELLEWSELAHLAAEGVTLASHGLTHRRLGGLDPDQLRGELSESRALIRRRTGVDPEGLAYPYGDVDGFSRHVAAAHYAWACTTLLAPVDRSARRFALPRLDMHYYRDLGSLQRWGEGRFLRRLFLLRQGRRLRSLFERSDHSHREGVQVRDPATETETKVGVRPVRSGRPNVPPNGGSPSTGMPDLSVIVPAHRAAEELRESLEALLASDLDRERWQLVVVNDGTDPETRAVAGRYADVVLALEGDPLGPSYARNRGAEVAKGAILVFVDADVCVHEDTLRRFTEVFAEEPEVAAVFGSYDDDPPGPGLVSAYRNLLHHQVHQRNEGEAETFWAGCGAVRKSVFEDVGGYDEWHFRRPQIEDIELGRRMRLHGHRILLRADIQATHLKRWSLRDVVTSDLMHRGIPWMRLVLQEGESPGRRALNLSARHRWCVALAGLAPAGVLSSLVLWSLWPLVAGMAAAGAVAGLNYQFYVLVKRREGWLGVLLAVPLHLTHYLSNGFSAVAGWIMHSAVGAPLPPVDAAAFREADMDAASRLPSPPTHSLWYRNG